MITPSDGQSQSNMLRRIFVLLLVLGGFVATCHPTNTTVHKDLSTANYSHVNSHVRGVRKIILENINATDSRTSRKLEDNGSRDIGEATARKKYKGKGYGKLFLYFMGAAKTTWLYFMVHAIAAVAGKALIVGKVALAIATAVLLKKSSDHGEKVSYEIIKHPQHSYIQTHSSSIDYDHHGFGESGYGHRRRRRIVR